MNVAFERFILGILTYLLPGESCLHAPGVWPQILPPSQTNKDLIALLHSKVTIEFRKCSLVSTKFFAFIFKAFNAGKISSIS